MPNNTNNNTSAVTKAAFTVILTQCLLDRALAQVCGQSSAREPSNAKPTPTPAPSSKVNGVNVCRASRADRYITPDCYEHDSRTFDICERGVKTGKCLGHPQQFLDTIVETGTNCYSFAVGKSGKKAPGGEVGFCGDKDGCEKLDKALRRDGAKPLEKGISCGPDENHIASYVATKGDCDFHFAVRLPSTTHPNVGVWFHKSSVYKASEELSRRKQPPKTLPGGFSLMEFEDHPLPVRMDVPEYKYCNQYCIPRATYPKREKRPAPTKQQRSSGR